jgi:hypothetical protein
MLVTVRTGVAMWWSVLIMPPLSIDGLALSATGLAVSHLH